jgi:hypothetical protein
VEGEIKRLLAVSQQFFWHNCYRSRSLGETSRATPNHYITIVRSACVHSPPRHGIIAASYHSWHDESLSIEHVKLKVNNNSYTMSSQRVLPFPSCK